MLLILVLAIILITVQNARNREKYNMRALAALIGSLLYVGMITAMDMLAVRVPFVASLFAPVYPFMLIGVPIAVVILAISGGIKYAEDKSIGGASAALVGVVIVLGVGFITMTNIAASAHSRGTEQSVRDQGDYMKARREADLDRKYSARMITFTSEADGFSVMMPEYSEYRSAAANLDDKDHPLGSVYGELIKNNTAYCVTCIRELRDKSDLKQACTVLELDSDYSVRDQTIKLLSTRRVSHRGHPTDEYLARTEKGCFTRARYFSAGDRIYKVMAYAKTLDQLKSTDIDAFLDSFTIFES